MQVHIQALPFDAKALRGLSERLLLSHHQNNYGGAVTRLNAIRAQLAALRLADAPGFQLNGLKREELMATNAMLLHELYFASLGGDGVTMEPSLQLALDTSFGSAERWRQEFVACAKALGGASGWMVLAYHPREGVLVNQWAADHAHALVGGMPLLVLDMYEHAYHMDHVAAAGAYVDAFMQNIAWDSVHARYRAAVHAASEPFAADADALGNAAVLDVRRAGAFARASSMVPGARWRDPAAVHSWTHECPLDRPVVVYCVHGHEVSRATAVRLRAAGVDARYLRGGIHEWTAAGRPVVGRPPG